MIREGLSLLLAYEVWPGAGGSEKARYVLKRIAKLRSVVVVLDRPDKGYPFEPICPTQQQRQRTDALLNLLLERRARIAAELQTESWEKH